MSQELPDLADVLDSFLQSFGLAYYPKYDQRSGRSIKNNMKVKGWRTETNIEVFVYEDNTVGLRFIAPEVELDLDAHDPDFFPKLESWLKAKIQMAEKMKG